MKSIIIAILLMSTVVAFGQETVIQVDMYNNEVEWQKVEVTIVKDQILIDHFKNRKSSLFVRHTYDILAGPNSAIVGNGIEYTVRLQPLKYTTYTLVAENHRISIVDNKDFNKINYYSGTDIGRVLK